MEETNTVELIQNSVSDVYEVNYKWNIPNYQFGQIYSEKLKLNDEIECTIMLIPSIENGQFNVRDRFVRSYFTVYFTKVPADDNRQTFFDFDVRTSFKKLPVAASDFRKVLMLAEGFRGKRNNLTSSNWRNLIDKDFSLKMNVRFTLNDSSFKSFHLENFEKERSKLPLDIASLYNDMKYADIKLICANNEEVPANKALLTARSSVFAKLLTNEIDTYEIGENFSTETVLEFLRFLYSDTLSVDKFDANTVELLELASKYEVSELAKLCKQDLLSGCKAKVEEISKKFVKLSCQEISGLEDFAEISKCVKILYKFTKNIE